MNCDHFAKLLPQLASYHPGEVVATAAVIRCMVGLMAEICANYPINFSNHVATSESHDFQIYETISAYGFPCDSRD